MIDWLVDHFDYYPGDRDDDDWMDEHNEDEWECVFGTNCLNPHFIHRRDECYTVEMAQAWQEEEQASADSHPLDCLTDWMENLEGKSLEELREIRRAMGHDVETSEQEFLAMLKERTDTA